MTVRVRIAPSPTGYLHVGNIRTALINWLFARAHGGAFLLRIDDTDRERSRPEYETAIYEDMEWVGLRWDETAHQSKRMDCYALAAEKLKAGGRLYPCYETSEELEVRRKFALSAGKPPVYDRASLKLSEAEKQAYEAAGRKPHWRFLLEDKPVEWHDLVRGPTKFQGGHLSDPVLLREDGMPVYMLASVVDDGELSITHVLRGEDHVSNNAMQIQLFEALGFAIPQFGHFALIKTKEGELSKRLGGGSVRELREEGIEPMAICSLFARLGSSQPVEAFTDLETLARGFDLSHFGRAPAIYDTEELKRLNARIISQMSYDQALPGLKALGLDTLDAEFWEAVRGNLSTLSEIADWWKLVHAAVQPVIADADFLRQAAALLPEMLDGQSWNHWVERIKAATGRKGKELFMPLRLALTGREDGPELKVLLPLIGRERALARLEGKTA